MSLSVELVGQYWQRMKLSRMEAEFKALVRPARRALVAII
jgi:hypothetical protein